MFLLFAATFAAALLVSPAASAAGGPQGPSSAVPPVSAASINDAAPNGANDKDPPLIAKAETLLDRAHFSPGAIDGLDGDNFRRAVRAFQEVNGLAVTGNLDPDTWNKLASSDSAPVLKFYTIFEADVAGPVTKVIPTQLEAMARLPGVSYTGPLAEIAEKFHMAQSLLQRLNPRADFERAGTKIIVADVPEMKLSPGRHAVEAVPPKDHQGPVAATIVVDKPAGNVRAYDRDGKLLGFYPATMGSDEKPAPSGVFKVKGVAWNPLYHYYPEFAWKGVKTKRNLTIEQGPNNPVGLVWIDLTAPSYGIHGTPDPEDIGKTQSHGCIRLTNWDAVDLAAMARPGTVVRFDDQDLPVAPRSVPVGEKQPPEVKAASGRAPADKAPGANAKDEKPLASVSGMPASDYAQCVSDLTSAKVVFEQAGDVTQQGCKLSGAVKLKSVTTAFGTVEISGEPAMLCSFARQFSGWVREVAAPLTLGYAGQRLMRIEAGQGFGCRARYDKPGEVPSEHAKGDALDITAFVLADNRRIPVKQQASDIPPAGDLIHALRTTACGYFTTVLGPGSDPAHEDHFHFDTGLHGATPNYRICE